MNIGQEILFIYNPTAINTQLTDSKLIIPTHAHICILIHNLLRQEKITHAETLGTVYIYLYKWKLTKMFSPLPTHILTDTEVHCWEQTGRAGSIDLASVSKSGKRPIKYQCQIPMCMCVCTWTAELFALDLADAFVRKAAGTGASSSAGLNRVVLQVVS